jgi:hypothetical protein
MAALADWIFPYGADSIQDLKTTAMDLPWLKRIYFETTLE